MKKIVTTDGQRLVRRSRWIKIRQNYNPSKRNGLWYYVTDSNGYREGQVGFDASSGLYLSYFQWNGRTWAIEQFFRLGGIMGGAPMIFEEGGRVYCISGYDSENYFNPILIETDDYGEYVRVYEEE